MEKPDDITRKEKHLKTNAHTLEVLFFRFSHQDFSDRLYTYEMPAYTYTSTSEHGFTETKMKLLNVDEEGNSILKERSLASFLHLVFMVESHFPNGTIRFEQEDSQKARIITEIIEGKTIVRSGVNIEKVLISIWFILGKIRSSSIQEKNTKIAKYALHAMLSMLTRLKSYHEVINDGVEENKLPKSRVLNLTSSQRNDIDELLLILATIYHPES